jgi:predicted RND superfamily exporter protein
MMISHLPSIQIFAQMASVAILAALFGDLVMLPALLACFVRPR